MPYKIHDRDLRGKTKTGWLDSWHTFSFGSFRDPERVRFRSLRVINEDIVIPGAGFPTHPHDNMEIITYMLSGALAHKDSMGNGAVIRPGEIQKMSAGSGVTHSEFNASNDNPAHLVQIWIMPNVRDIEPGYEQITVDDAQARAGFTLVGGPENMPNVVSIRQDARLYLARPAAGQTIHHAFAPGRGGFLQVLRGELEVEGARLKEGDGLEISDVATLTLTAQADSEAMLFDLG